MYKVLGCYFLGFVIPNLLLQYGVDDPSQTTEVIARAAINDFSQGSPFSSGILSRSLLIKAVTLTESSFVRFVKCWEYRSPGQLPVGLPVMVK